jgi:hypothetical protein
MSHITQTLAHNNIPFKVLKDRKNIILVPHGMIIIKKYNQLIQENKFKKFIQSINGIDNTIYLYIDELNLYDATFDMLCQKILSQNLKINIITTPNDILQYQEIYDYYYYIDICGPIWSMVVEPEKYHQILLDKIVRIHINVYNRAIVIMTDEEIEILMTFNIVIVDSLQENDVLCYIKQDNYNARDTFNLFIKYVPLSGLTRQPLRIIEHITTECDYCHAIIYIDRFHECKSI